MRLASLAVVLLAAPPAGAQDRARLDDFAVPTADQASDEAVAVEQLAPDHEVLWPQQPRDHSVAIPQAPPQPRVPLDQLAAESESAEADQLTGRETSRRIAPAAVSSAADSIPQGLQRIGGRDRCDPQSLESAEHAECLRILELRAAEFEATERPRLSAEEKILAQQQRRADDAVPSTNLRLRLATVADPNAELTTNQEIAALYLGREAAAPPAKPDELPTVPELPAGDLIEALQAALPGTVQP